MCKIESNIKGSKSFKKVCQLFEAVVGLLLLIQEINKGENEIKENIKIS